MTGPAGVALALLGSYVSGSVPSAYLAGRALKGVDLRTVGSGNLGATNVYRELGALPAIAVLLTDGLKGALPAMYLPPLLIANAVSPWWSLACGGAAILGHAKPVFLLWRGGGKGVATAAGIFLAVAPVTTAVCIAAFIVAVALTRYVSLGSILGAALLPAVEWYRSGLTPVTYAGVVVALFVLVTHRSNIQRLAAGTERRFGKPGAVAR